MATKTKAAKTKFERTIETLESKLDAVNKKLEDLGDETKYKLLKEKWEKEAAALQATIDGLKTELETYKKKPEPGPGDTDPTNDGDPKPPKKQEPFSLSRFLFGDYE